MNEGILDLIYEISDKKYPYFIVSTVDIISNDNGIVRYKVEVCSKLEPSKWKRWEPIEEINLIDLRDKVIEEVLTEI